MIAPVGSKAACMLIRMSFVVIDQQNSFFLQGLGSSRTLRWCEFQSLPLVAKCQGNTDFVR